MQVFQPSLPFIITTRFSSNFQFFTWSSVWDIGLVEMIYRVP
jgi:hypothetical protein